MSESIRYYRNDNVLGLTNTDNLSSILAIYESQELESPIGTCVDYIFIDNGVDLIEVASGVAEVRRDSIGEGYQSAIWSCSGYYSYVKRIVVDSWVEIGGENHTASFATEELNWDGIEAKDWEFIRYTSWDYSGGGDDYVYSFQFVFGASGVYDSRILGIEPYSAPEKDMWVREGGSWKYDINSWVRSGGSWKGVTDLKVRDGGSWK